MTEDQNHLSRIITKIDKPVDLDPGVTMIARIVDIKIDQADTKRNTTQVAAIKTQMIPVGTRMVDNNPIIVVEAQTGMVGAAKIDQGGQ